MGGKSRRASRRGGRDRVVNGPVRQAGRARLDDGRLIVWSVADGRGGRRWRVIVEHEGELVSSTLLEVSAEGRPARLELTTADGLLTLHPEASGGLHGNVVTATGVRHLSIAWSDEHELEIEGVSIASALAARRLAPTTPVGEGRTVPVVVVGADLSVHEDSRVFSRLSDKAWRIDIGAGSEVLTVDARGIPHWAGESDEWPLELDSHR
jgi:hypothetical protein